MCLARRSQQGDNGISAWGMASAKSRFHDFEQHLQECLSESSITTNDKWWPYIIGNQYLETINWEHRIGELHRENQNQINDNESLTRKFAESVSNFAKQAIPCIDQWYSKL